MSRATRKKKRPAVIRALAVWIDTPVETLFDECGRGFHVRFSRGRFVFVDEQFRVHGQILGPNNRAPRFKVVPPPKGIVLEMGRTPGEFTIKHSS